MRISFFLFFLNKSYEMPSIVMIFSMEIKEFYYPWLNSITVFLGSGCLKGIANLYAMVRFTIE